MLHKIFIKQLHFIVSISIQGVICSNLNRLVITCYLVSSCYSYSSLTPVIPLITGSVFLCRPYMKARARLEGQQSGWVSREDKAGQNLEKGR